MTNERRPQDVRLLDMMGGMPQRFVDELTGTDFSADEPEEIPRPRRNLQMILTLTALAACIALLIGSLFLFSHLREMRQSGETSSGVPVDLYEPVTTTATRESSRPQQSGTTLPTAESTKASDTTGHSEQTSSTTADSGVTTSQTTGTAQSVTQTTESSETRRTESSVTRLTEQTQHEVTDAPDQTGLEETTSWQNNLEGGDPPETVPMGETTEMPAETTPVPDESQLCSTDSPTEDPDRLIAELKTGRKPSFSFGDGTSQSPCCEFWFQTYGVAFLCDDIGKLKKEGIGGAAVNWSDGAWTEYGSNGYGYVAGATKTNCLVQPLDGFLRRYGSQAALGKDLPATEIRKTRLKYRIVLGYEYAGQTVYMVSAGLASNAKTTVYGGGSLVNNSGKYCDYEAVIRALAKEPSVTLLGLVTGREKAYGDLPELQGELAATVRFDYGVPSDLNVLAGLNAYLSPLSHGGKYPTDATKAKLITVEGQVKGFHILLDIDKIAELAQIKRPGEYASQTELDRYRQEIIGALARICTPNYTAPDLHYRI